jgi:dTDP-4-dehydrorhamnose reductase
MKIILTGSSGQLGSSIMNLARIKNIFKVESFDRFKWQNSNNLQKINLLSKFDVIIHSAANTDVEFCEANPGICYSDNVYLTEEIANIAEVSGCKMIYISSTGIYGKTKLLEGFVESDMPVPTTIHHKSKFLAENLISQICKNPLILRTGWLFGGSPSNPKNFVARRIEDGLKNYGGELKSNIEQRGNPTFTNDFVFMLFELITNNEYGIFNLVNEESASRFDYVKKILEFSDIEIKLLPSVYQTFNRKAEVSLNETASNQKLYELGYKYMPSWKESLEYYIKIELKDWISKLKTNGNS